MEKLEQNDPHAKERFAKHPIQPTDVSTSYAAVAVQLKRRKYLVLRTRARWVGRFDATIDISPGSSSPGSISRLR